MISFLLSGHCLQRNKETVLSVPQLRRGGTKGEPPTTASGGSFVGGEINRNERAPQCGVATIEIADTVLSVPQLRRGGTKGRFCPFRECRTAEPSLTFRG